MIQIFACSCTFKLRWSKLCLQNLMFILYSNVLVTYLCCQSVSSVAQLCSTFVTPRTAACQASLSITNSWSLLKLMHQNSYEHAELDSLGLSLSAHAGPSPLPHQLPLPSLSFSNSPSSEKPSLPPPRLPPPHSLWHGLEVLPAAAASVAAHIPCTVTICV